MGFLDEVRETLGKELYEVLEDCVYKVSTSAVNEEFPQYRWETDSMYFRHLDEAQKWLLGRVQFDRERKELATPEEIQQYGIPDQVLPETDFLEQYELHFLIHGKIETIQYTLSEVFILPKDLSHVPLEPEMDPDTKA